jgi:hypothetical protein
MVRCLQPPFGATGPNRTQDRDAVMTMDTTTRRRTLGPTRFRTALLASASLLAATAAVAAIPSDAAPVGAGPAPIDFNLTDDQGRWFDTGQDLSAANAGQSLAVAVLPRVGTDLPVSTADLLNADLAAQLTNAPVAARMGAGVDTGKLLNLDQLRKAVGGTSLGSRAAGGLVSQLTAELAGRPIDQPVDLSTLPAGKALMAAADQAGEDLASVPVTVNFHVAAPDAMGVHTATSLIWPEGAKGFPFDQSAAWRGDHTVELTKPGLYAFACKIPRTCWAPSSSTTRSRRASTSARSWS